MYILSFKNLIHFKRIRRFEESVKKKYKKLTKGQCKKCRKEAEKYKGNYKIKCKVQKLEKIVIFSKSRIPEKENIKMSSYPTNLFSNILHHPWGACEISNFSCKYQNKPRVSLQQ